MHFRSHGNKIYSTVHDLWGYNYLEDTGIYLDKAANIREIDLGKHGFGRLLAFGYPESYYDKPLTKTLFAQLNFDIADNGDFYVSFEADSLMYRYDLDYNQLVCFGFAGRDMDLNYLRWDSYDQPWKERLAERMSRGFYNAVEYVDETGLLFRSYRKGGGSVTDGLQVYRDGVLVGDVDVPLGFGWPVMWLLIIIPMWCPTRRESGCICSVLNGLPHRKNKFRALAGAFRSSLFT